MNYTDSCLPLTRSMWLCFEQVWDVSSPRQEVVVGGATLALFSSKKQLKTGKQKLRLWHSRQADGSVPTITPGKVLFRTNYNLVIMA